MKKFILCGLVFAAFLYASWPLEVCGDNNLQLFPSVAKTSNGYITAFVNNNTDGKHCEIYTQRFTDDGEEDSLWNSAVLVSVDTVTYYHGHRLAARAIPGNTDTAIVAWINHKDYTLCAQKVGPSGSKEWNGGDRPKIIATIAKHTYYEVPQMCSDGAGGLVFASLDSNYQRKLINDRRDRSVLFVWVESKIFDKNLINDIIVDAVLKVYNKPQLNPFVGF